jgi:hypothetical protein
MVKMAQKSSKKEQRKAAIVVVKGFKAFEGFVHQYWFPNVNDPVPAKLIKVCGERGLILQQVSLYDIVERMSETVFLKYVKTKISGLHQEQQEKTLGEMLEEYEVELEAKLEKLKAK